MLKSLGRSRWVRTAISATAANYLRLVRATTRFTIEPADFPHVVGVRAPLIVAMWHGQHFMVPFANIEGARVSALVSRSIDGDINAGILERVGVSPIRGSGGARFKTKRGGVRALRAMLLRLAEGWTIVLTADVPKVGRKAGPGIVALAQKSGCPIYPIAVVTNRRIDLRSWDRASVPLPFGRGAMVLGSAIVVASDSDETQRETARLAVERGLDAAHARAYVLCGSHDPVTKGAGKDSHA